MNEELEKAMNAFIAKFGFTPVTVGLSDAQYQSPEFISMINDAVKNNDPEVDFSRFLPDGSIN